MRTRDDSHLDALTEAGAAEVVPEVMEASLMLVAHALTMLDMPLDQVLAVLRQTRRERYKMLQGHYHGESVPTCDSAGNPYRLLHAVTLNGKARGINQTLDSLALRDVEVRAVKRNQATLDNPAENLTLQQDDTLILYGTLEAVEASEIQLLGG